MAKEKTKIDMKRININAPASLVDRVKEYADSIGINVTSAYIVLLNQALDQKQSMNNMPVLIDMYNQMLSLSNNNDSNDILLDDNSEN